MLPSECLGSTNLAEQGGDFKASRTPISATLLSLKGERGQGSAEPSEPMWKSHVLRRGSRQGLSRRRGKRER